MQYRYSVKAAVAPMRSSIFGSTSTGALRRIKQFTDRSMTTYCPSATSTSAKGKKEPPAPKKKEKKAPQKRSKPSTSSEAAKASAVPARRKTKVRKAALDKAGNLASEILDMLLSTEEESNGEEGGADSSDESWK